jgi:hypothetical protein
VCVYMSLPEYVRQAGLHPGHGTHHVQHNARKLYLTRSATPIPRLRLYPQFNMGTEKQNHATTTPLGTPRTAP